MYEILFFTDAGSTRLDTLSLHDALPISPASVTVSPSTVSAGGTLTVTVANGPGNPMDWVTLGRVARAGRRLNRWNLVNATAATPATRITNTTLQFVAPPAAGPYEIRWFA